MHDLIFSKRLPEMRCEIKRRGTMWLKPLHGLHQWHVESVSLSVCLSVQLHSVRYWIKALH